MYYLCFRYWIISGDSIKSMLPVALIGVQGERKTHYVSKSFIHSLNIKKMNEHLLCIKHCARNCGYEEKEDKTVIIEESTIECRETDKKQTKNTTGKLLNGASCHPACSSHIHLLLFYNWALQSITCSD